MIEEHLFNFLPYEMNEPLLAKSNMFNFNVTRASFPRCQTCSQLPCNAPHKVMRGRKFRYPRDMRFRSCMRVGASRISVKRALGWSCGRHFWPQACCTRCLVVHLDRFVQSPHCSFLTRSTGKRKTRVSWLPLQAFPRRAETQRASKRGSLAMVHPLLHGARRNLTHFAKARTHFA